jgi:hypothetical protein
VLFLFEPEDKAEDLRDLGFSKIKCSSILPIQVFFKDLAKLLAVNLKL